MDEEQIKLHEDAYTYHFFFNHGLFDELKHYEDLIAETESFIKLKLTSFKNASDREIIDERFGKKLQYEIFFPTILWKSLFLSTYFLLENSLEQICKNLKKSKSYSLAVKDISGNGIFRSSLYLKKVCNIIEPFQTVTWNAIMDLNKIRNVLVHSDSILSKTNIELINVCSKYSSINRIDYDDNDYIIEFGNEFCKESLNKIEKLFNDIYHAMREANTSN
jgi:hypothetical protein